MWAAILAGWISAMLQSLSGYDQHAGRAHGHRFRHDLLQVPGRLVRHAGQLLLRLPPGRGDRLAEALAAPANDREAADHDVDQHRDRPTISDSATGGFRSELPADLPSSVT
ncbi:hypothetical protein [Frankia sp. Cj3]|uniref:hypothetical protein n=1 Tax=Frankia sp. Cj3 TaxID=2880976 RepID=UPI001EF48645|nr:hypothetical protein [Frankia sp. Cj3]